MIKIKLPKEFIKQYEFAQYWNVELDEMPSCCGIGVLHTFPHLTEDQYSGRIKRAINQAIMYMEYFAKADGEFTTIIAASSVETGAFTKGLEDRKWKINNRFTNRNSGNNVRLYYKFLPSSGESDEWYLYALEPKDYVKRFCKDVD